MICRVIGTSPIVTQCEKGECKTSTYYYVVQENGLRFKFVFLEEHSKSFVMVPLQVIFYNFTLKTKNCFNY